MQKEDVIKALKEIADLLEITEASPFEIRAFRSAANGLEDWQGNLEDATEANNLTEIPSVGKGISKVIAQLVQTGTADELTNVRSQVPEELPTLLRFRGLGPKRVKTLWQELNIESPEDLEKAIDDGSVHALKGFGAKTVETMKASIEYFRGEADAKPAPQLATVPQAVKSSGAIFAGTSGYSYPNWKGSFYPEKAKTNDLLSHYSEKLSSVEINNTFYRFPSEKVVQQWKTQTSETFQFALKAHRRVTHQMRLNRGTIIRIQEFVERCSVLGPRLGCILFQLPPDFERDDERLQNLLGAIPPGPRYAVEFRHSSWHDDSVFAQLQSKNVACVSGDSEDSPVQKLVTADFVYCRLRKTAYGEKELDQWNEWFHEQRTANRDVLVYLKHDDTGDIPLSIESRWSQVG